MILWLLRHQRPLVETDQVKLTISCGKNGIKYSLERWYDDAHEDAA